MNNEVNDRVIDLLKTSGMTEVQLAEAIRKPASTVYRITRKEVRPSKPTLQLIATALNVNYLWLTYGKGDPLSKTNAEQTHSERSITDKAIELLEEQLTKKDEQIASLLAVIGKLNFPKPLNEPSAEVYTLSNPARLKASRLAA